MTAVASPRRSRDDTTPAPPSHRPRISADGRVLLLVTLVVLLPLALAEAVWWAPGGAGDFNRRVSLAPFDLALLGLLLVGGLDLLRRRPAVPRTRLSGLVVAVTLLFATSLLAHPSPRGIEFAVRVIAGVAVVDAWRRIEERERQALRALLLAVGAAQAVLAVMQSARGAVFGVEPIDYPGALYSFGTSSAGRGGLTHPYHLVVFLLVCVAAGLVGIRHASRRRWWFVGLAACGEGIGVTYSRTALLALAAAGLLALVHSKRSGERVLLFALAMVGVGMVVAALSFGDGWYARYETSTSSAADSGRVELYRDAMSLTADDPILGVGPGRYVIAVAELDDRRGAVLPAHDVALHLSAELGVPAAVLAMALVGWLLVRLAKRSPLALLPVAVVAPFFALDAFPYVFPTGLAITAIAVGLATTAAPPAAQATR